MRLPAPRPGPWGLLGGATPLVTFTREETEAAKGKVLPKVTQRSGTRRGLNPQTPDGFFRKSQSTPHVAAHPAALTVMGG